MWAARRAKRAMRWVSRRWTTSPRCLPAGRLSIRFGETEMAKPVLLVTRRLPPAIEALAAKDFDARLTPSEVVMPDLLAQAQGADAILCCPGDKLDAETIAALPASVKVV